MICFFYPFVEEKGCRTVFFPGSQNQIGKSNHCINSPILYDFKEIGNANGESPFGIGIK
jgi:hypothetical protein